MTEWISVSERMPKESGYVLVWAPHGKNQTPNLVTTAYHFADTGLFQSGGAYSHSIGGVTHWMPLPEPPEEVRHE